jgi:hypothetical protein
MGNRRGRDVKEWIVVVLWSVLLWGCTEPARIPMRAPVPPPQILTQECGGLRVQVTLERRRQGVLVADVFITETDSQIPSDISRVVLAFTRKAQANTTTTIVAELRETGHYAPLSEFSLTPDPWTVEVTVRRVNSPAVSCLFSFDL